ncbi:pyridoxal 5'-phosphate synthase glutaminase subunit PdxT [Deinococcus sp.]|uniref:pyridoxal 5'-phosphate synthase glutaminase subunit PdxT n=1 Tax=Deinococcus sp. TaxID=47478 RepID=UPI0025C24601|nr:pyridoxal 5'-phosphate synthase glutaminase subunit PdxT [Deinococcus sp.]
MAGNAALSVGVLALQGAFREHVRMLHSLGAQAREVRLPGDLEGLQGLILPGGESTTISRLMTDYALWDPVRQFAAAGGGVWGTCAGAIMLARTIEGVSPNLGTQPGLELLDITVRRNAFGRQVDSFAVPLEVRGLDGPFPAVFIRAPLIERAGPEVEVLATQAGGAVLVRRGRVMASSFHPELTTDSRLHSLFLAGLSQL